GESSRTSSSVSRTLARASSTLRRRRRDASRMLPASAPSETWLGRTAVGLTVHTRGHGGSCQDDEGT
ncbi:hypothetical protein IscW_ISCW013524, partial [Ixodes scapularis]